MSKLSAWPFNSYSVDQGSKQIDSDVMKCCWNSLSHTLTHSGKTQKQEEKNKVFGLKKKEHLVPIQRIFFFYINSIFKIKVFSHHVIQSERLNYHVLFWQKKSLCLIFMLFFFEWGTAASYMLILYNKKKLHFYISINIFSTGTDNPEVKLWAQDEWMNVVGPMNKKKNLNFFTVSFMRIKIIILF